MAGNDIEATIVDCVMTVYQLANDILCVYAGEILKWLLKMSHLKVVA